jgi:hypothetical protein
MGTVGVPDRYPLPKVEQVVEVRYLYCHTGPEGKLMQAKYFGKVRDDIAVTECAVAQLKFKENDDEADEGNVNRNEESHVACGPPGKTRLEGHCARLATRE